MNKEELISNLCKIEFETRAVKDLNDLRMVKKCLEIIENDIFEIRKMLEEEE